MFNITNHEGNANQNHSEIPPHSCQDGRHQKTIDNKCCVRMWRKGNLNAILLGT